MHVDQAEWACWHQHVTVKYTLVVLVYSLQGESLFLLVRLQLGWEHLGDAQEVQSHITILHLTRALH